MSIPVCRYFDKTTQGRGEGSAVGAFTNTGNEGIGEGSAVGKFISKGNG